jgi:hypothetical protein
MKKEITKLATGVKIIFTGEVKKKNIVSMVDNCSKGKCECMSEETKSKITNMEVNGINGNVDLLLEGKITKEEIELALSKSTKLK